MFKGQDVGFKVYKVPDVGLRVWDLGFRVRGVELGVEGVGFRIWGISVPGYNWCEKVCGLSTPFGVRSLPMIGGTYIEPPQFSESIE